MSASIEEFAVNHPIQYRAVIQPIETELSGHKKFDHKTINVIQGQTQSGKTEVTFLLAHCLRQQGYTVFLMTKKSNDLRNQFVQRSANYKHFRGVEMKSYDKSNKFDHRHMYIYEYWETHSSTQMNNFISGNSHKTAIIFDEFHIITHMMSDYIKHKGIVGEITTTHQLIISIMQKSLIFGITATPFSFRDADAIMANQKWQTRLFLLPPEPTPQQRYVSLLDTQRHTYDDYLDVLTRTPQYYNNKKIMPVVIFYDERTNESHMKLADQIRDKYPLSKVSIINQDYRADVVATYASALSQGFTSVVFIGHTCLTEGLSFRPHNIPNSDDYDYVIHGPTDLVFHENIKLEEKLEDIVQIIGRVTGYVPVDSSPDIRVYYSMKSAAWFQISGYLDKWFESYQDIDRKVIFAQPALSEEIEPLISPKPTKFYKNVNSAVCIQIFKRPDHIPSEWINLNPVVSPLNPTAEYAKLKVSEFHGQIAKQNKFKKDCNVMDHYPWYGGDRPVLKQVVIEPDCELRGERYLQNNIVIPHPMYIPADGAFENIPENVTWDQCLKLKFSTFIDSSNPLGYILIDDYIISCALKGQIVSRYVPDTYVFIEAPESIRLMGVFIDSFPYKKITAPMFKKSLLQMIADPTARFQFIAFMASQCKLDQGKKGTCLCIFHKYSKERCSIQMRINDCITEIVCLHPEMASVLNCQQTHSQTQVKITLSDLPAGRTGLKFKLKSKSKSKSIIQPASQSQQISSVVNEPPLQPVVVLNKASALSSSITNDKMLYIENQLGVIGSLTYGERRIRLEKELGKCPDKHNFTDWLNIKIRDDF